VSITTTDYIVKLRTLYRTSGVHSGLSKQSEGWPYSQPALG